jgi:hypothetical protein
MDIREFTKVKDGFKDAGTYHLHTRVAGGGNCSFDDAHGFDKIQWTAGNRLEDTKVESTHVLR